MIKKHILSTALIFILCNVLSGYVWCEEIAEEDSEKQAIAGGIRDFFYYIITNNEENVLNYISADYDKFRNEMKQEIINAQKISNYRCGEPRIISYKHLDSSRLTVEFTIECNGVDYNDLKDVKRVISKRLLMNKEKNGNMWNIIDAKDIDVANKKESREETDSSIGSF